MSKSVKRIASIALPVIGTIVAPGIGTAIGSALGAGAAAAPIVGGAVLGGVGGAIGGGGIKSALLGAAGGGLAGGAGTIAGASGLTGAGAKAFTSALKGGGIGLTTGDPKNALIGAALGGAGGYLSAGGSVPGLGNVAGASLDQTTGITGLAGPTKGTGVLGALTNNTGIMAGGGASSVGSSTGGGSMFSDALKAGGTLYSGYNTQKANEEIQDQLMAAQGRASQQLQPYQQMGLDAQTQLSQALQAGFNPGDLASDPGYQFQLEQGNTAAERQLGAMGMSQSGAAIKAAQERAQGLANTTYNDAYNRWLSQNQQLANVGNTGYNAAQNIGNIQQQMGNIGAYTTAANNQNFNQTLASLIESNLLSRALQGVF